MVSSSSIVPTILTYRARKRIVLVRVIKLKTMIILLASVKLVYLYTFLLPGSLFINLNVMSSAFVHSCLCVCTEHKATFRLIK